MAEATSSQPVVKPVDRQDSGLEAIDAPRAPKFAALPYSTAQSGLVYDVRMRFHVESTPSTDDIHPEDPRRIHAIFEAFVAAGLAWRPGQPPGDFYMGRIDTRKVTEDEVCLVHTKAHYDWVQSLRHMSAAQLAVEQQYPDYKMDSVYLSPNTPFCAELAAGGAIEACRAIMLGKVKNAFAIIRPPGHHAEREDAKGFCFFDNVSIAAKSCQREFGFACRKIFILDFDVHHGNAIQQAHYDNPNVLYISLHVYKNGTFYPEGTYRDQRERYGDHLHCGEGAGLGKNVNIPWSKMGMGDAEYVYAFQQVVMPIAHEFDPDLVIIAAGFDAARGDMLGGCDVTPTGYAHMTHMLMSLARGKVAVCLEGGYNLDSIAKSGTAVAQTLMGEPPPRLEDAEPALSAVADIKTVIREQSKYWNSMYPKGVSQSTIANGVRMHDVVRKYEAMQLWDAHQMSSLFIKRHNSFRDQVLATSDYMEDKPLLVIIHDPPEIVASPEPVTGRIEQHNAWLTTGERAYIDEAIRLGFGVIDITLPKHLPPEEATDDHQDPLEISDRMSDATQLLTYVYENYIDSGSSDNVFLMGIDVGHGAITRFLRTHEETAPERVMLTIGFVQDAPLQPVRSNTTEELSLWYYRNSAIYVSSQHSYWKTEMAAKPRKKYGRLSRSMQGSMSDMLMERKGEVFNLLIEETKSWREENQARSRPLDMHDVPISPTRKLPPISNFALTPSPKAATPHR